MAKWINKHAPKHLRIIGSPATRCQQTAAALGRVAAKLLWDDRQD